MDIILGIDPGSRVTGFGVIASDGNRHRYLTSGCITMSTQQPLAERLEKIFTDLNDVITAHAPAVAAIEQVFVYKNANVALKLGQARGAAIVAVAKHALPLAEYSPRSIKSAVVGYGGADKIQVQHMIKRLLNLNAVPPSDAADALAVALCHAHTGRGLAGLVGVRTRSRGRYR